MIGGGRRQDPANGAGKARPADRRLDMAGPLRAKSALDEAAVGDAGLPEGIGEHLRRVLWPGRGAADKMAENLIAARVGGCRPHEIRLTESPEQAHRGSRPPLQRNFRAGKDAAVGRSPLISTAMMRCPAALDQSESSGYCCASGVGLRLLCWFRSSKAYRLS